MFWISQACYHYEARRSIEDDDIAQWLLSVIDDFNREALASRYRRIV